MTKPDFLKGRIHHNQSFQKSMKQNRTASQTCAFSVGSKAIFFAVSRLEVELFVHVIGLHVVPFRRNWIRQNNSVVFLSTYM